MATKGKKVFVGMSGGVDSSVSAALLKKAGYDVTGVFIKVWSPDWLPCTWKEERRDAMRVAAVLDIPFITMNLEDDYKRGVVDYLLSEYKAGRTPNPDVMCNREIKFGSFLRKAKELGADYIATGHYAQVYNSGDKIILKEGSDKNKDQSYFLWTLPQETLQHVLFPVGGLQKSEVRALAQKFDLPTAAKKDSQGICFLGEVDMKEFLSHYIPQKPGSVLNEQGEVIGEHNGVVFYTLGERHGFAISQKTNHDQPYYIVKKDITANTLTVSHKYSEDSLKTTNSVKLSSVNWTQQQPEVGQPLLARYRYRQNPVSCELQINKENVVVKFTEPQAAVSVGQSLVIYNNDICLGGGIIEEVL